MTELDALLTAILREPGEDLPRLVFADWLDDHADAMPDPAAARARAEFIRVQIRMSILEEECECSATKDGCPRCKEYGPLERRSQELLDTFEGDWAPQILGAFAAHSGTAFSFSRGFPSKVTLPDLPSWERWGREIAAAAPVVEMVVADRVPHEEAGRFLWQDAGGGVCPLPDEARARAGLPPVWTEKAHV